MSARRIEPDVITGEAIRMRRRASRIARAIRRASRSPFRGQNHGRTAAPPTRTAGHVRTRPLRRTLRVVQSRSKPLP
jgi:hypothetical protein